MKNIFVVNFKKYQYHVYGIMIILILVGTIFVLKSLPQDSDKFKYIVVTESGSSWFRDSNIVNSNGCIKNEDLLVCGNFIIYPNSRYNPKAEALEKKENYEK